MSWSGIRKNLTDTLFSNIVRTKANWICERCRCDFSQMKAKFDCSHFHTRGNKRTRWDFDNVLALCRGCHIYFSNYPGEHAQFMKEKLGIGRFNLLMARKERQLNEFKVDELAIRQGLKIEWQRILEKQKSEIIGSR